VLLLLALILVQMELISDQFVTLMSYSSLEYLIAYKTLMEQATQLTRNGIQLTPNSDGLLTVFSQKEQMDLTSTQLI
jgi:hypothetical protein